MTWIRIDNESVQGAMSRVIAASQRSLPVLEGLRGLAADGLGDLGSSTAELAAMSYGVFSDCYETYLSESIGVLEKVLVLVRDQQAASVIGAAGSSIGGFGAAGPLINGISPAAAIIGGTVVGGTSGWGTASGFPSGPAVVGGSLLGSVTDGDRTVAGLLSGFATVGGTPTFANDPLLRAAAAAQERGNVGLASQLLSAQGAIATSNERTIANWTAPDGARLMGPYGPSSGYRAFGGYLEVPR